MGRPFVKGARETGVPSGQRRRRGRQVRVISLRDVTSGQRGRRSDKEFTSIVARIVIYGHVGTASRQSEAALELSAGGARWRLRSRHVFAGQRRVVALRVALGYRNAGGQRTGDRSAGSRSSRRRHPVRMAVALRVAGARVRHANARQTQRRVGRR